MAIDPSEGLDKACLDLLGVFHMPCDERQAVDQSLWGEPCGISRTTSGCRYQLVIPKRWTSLRSGRRHNLAQDAFAAPIRRGKRFASGKLLPHASKLPSP
jgi:hypothetical protein